MKKWMVTVSVLTLSASLLAGCGKGENTSETEQESSTQAETGAAEAAETETAVQYGPEAYLGGINAADYVTLGEYKGIEVTVNAPVVTEEEVQGRINNVLANHMVSTEVTDRPVEQGDTVNIDYEGKIDGVAFDGGTAQGQDLVIGSGSFIPGFEDGLIGAEAGETLDVNVTFPEDYRGTDVAGKDAVFTVTVNSISVKSLPEFNDEFVKGLDEGYSTAEEYRTHIYDMLMETARASRDAEAETAILAKVKENAQFKEPPTEMVKRYHDRLTSNMTAYASMFGQDLNTFLEAQGKSDADLQESAEEAARELVVMQAVADAEGLTVTPEEVEKALEENAALDGYEDLEEYKALIDYEAFEEYLMTEKVLDFLLENGKVTETEAAETPMAETETVAETETAETETETAAETEAAEAGTEAAEGTQTGTVAETQSGTE